MIPKEIKYNLHYDDVRKDFLRPPHGTTPATVEQNKRQKGLLVKFTNCWCVKEQLDEQQ